MKTPEEVTRALAHVKQFHPTLALVVFTSNEKWLYMDADFDAFEFGDDIDVSILLEAIDSVELLPAVFEVEGAFGL